ncbi:DDE superfamily endonuclease [uncultured archaeon]|nr:DDE superfamily endonuclease [uncultured archaeon]
MIRYWLTPAPDERFDEKVGNINSLYQQAQNLAQKGELVMSIEEMTGVQALERKHPGLPMAPGKVERREFEYIRHGTQSLIVSFAMACGWVDTISCGDTSNEEDFVSHVKEVVESSSSTSAGILSPTTSISINQNLS